MSGPSGVGAPSDVGVRYLAGAMRAEHERLAGACLLASMAHDRAERERERRAAYAIEDATRAASAARRAARRAALAACALALADVAVWTLALAQLAGGA